MWVGISVTSRALSQVPRPVYNTALQHRPAPSLPRPLLTACGTKPCTQDDNIRRKVELLEELLEEPRPLTAPHLSSHWIIHSLVTWVILSRRDNNSDQVDKEKRRIEG